MPCDFANLCIAVVTSCAQCVRFFSLKSWLPLVEQMAVFVKYYHTVAV